MTTAPDKSDKAQPAPPRRASEAELIHGDLQVYECTALTYWKRDGVERAVTYTVCGTVGEENK